MEARDDVLKVLRCTGGDLRPWSISDCTWMSRELRRERTRSLWGTPLASKDAISADLLMTAQIQCLIL